MSRVRWARPEGIHLTLKFLGDIPSSQVEAVTNAMRDAAEGSTPFALRLDTLGAFPHTRRARVIWCGVAGDIEQLFSLQERVETGLEHIGYPREGRPFTPHLTMCRVRESDRAPDGALLEHTLALNAPESQGPWPVREVCLMQTVPTSGGSRYDILATAKLQPGG